MHRVIIIITHCWSCTLVQSKIISRIKLINKNNQRRRTNEQNNQLFLNKSFLHSPTITIFHSFIQIIQFRDYFFFLIPLIGLHFGTFHFSLFFFKKKIFYLYPIRHPPVINVIEFTCQNC